ncbi:putative cell wall protein [Venturia nashicola]|uniref:Putative cell wall protein n=1 Tax=Venturia nashicola TaxID=86259 RepID=A0A4Z1NWC6_9PEZI|nr:putative cell wall protein [Venturia nashicola]TLD32138.1 putative cell wall protein [Venturia nashicola]
MHFTKIFSIGLLATSATAAPTASRRSLADVQAAFDKIQASIATMVTKINAWDGQAASVTGVMEESGKLLATIKSSTTAIQGSSAIGIVDAVGVLGPVNVLSAKVDDVVTALLTKKGQFDGAKVTGQVSEQLVQDQTATRELIKAILGKLPSMTVPIAQPIADGVSTKLDKAVTAFGPAGGAAPAAPGAPGAPATAA